MIKYLRDHLNSQALKRGVRVELPVLESHPEILGVASDELEGGTAHEGVGVAETVFERTRLGAALCEHKG